MHEKDWLYYHSRFQFFASIASIIFNSILIHLVIHKSPKRMGSYKNLLILFSTTGILYSIDILLTTPMHYAYGSTFLVMIKTTGTILSKDVAFGLNVAYCYFFGSSMALFAIHYIYRYLVASGSRLLDSFNSWKILFWFAMPVLSGFVFIVVAFICAPNPKTDELIREEILDALGWNISDYTYVGPLLYYKNEDGSYTIHWFHVITMIVCLCSMSSSVSMILVFGTKCYRKIFRMVLRGEISEKYRELQTQIFYALVIQTLIPVFLMHLPVFVLFAAAFTNQNLGLTSTVVGVTIGVFPAMDPLPTMFIIQSYRTALYDYVIHFIERILRRTMTILDNNNNTQFHYSCGSSFTTIIDCRNSLFSLDIMLFSQGVYCAFFGSSMALFSIHYIYRYFVSIGSPLLKTFNSWRISYWLMLPLCYAITWFVTGYYLCGPNEITDQHIGPHVLIDLGMKIGEYTYVGPYFYPKDMNGKTYVNWVQLGGMTAVSSTLMVSFATIVYFGLKCYNNMTKLTKQNTMSDRNRELQSQIFYALVAQTSIPIILMHIPVSILFGATFLDVDLGPMSGIVSMTIAFFPAIDPLPTIFIIKNYRKALIYYCVFLKRKLFCQDTNSVISIPESAVGLQQKISTISTTRVFKRTV